MNYTKQDYEEMIHSREWRIKKLNDENEALVARLEKCAKDMTNAADMCVKLKKENQELTEQLKLTVEQYKTISKNLDEIIKNQNTAISDKIQLLQENQALKDQILALRNK